MINKASWLIDRMSCIIVTYACFCRSGCMNRSPMTMAPCYNFVWRLLSPVLRMGLLNTKEYRKSILLGEIKLSCH
jgi:hypothetical protein